MRSFHIGNAVPYHPPRPIALTFELRKEVCSMSHQHAIETVLFVIGATVDSQVSPTCNIDLLVPRLRKAPQPSLSHRGAPADSDRAKKPPLVDPSGTGQELSPGDRVEGLGDFGIPTGEFGIVRQVNEDDALVKWDEDGRMRLHQPSLKKVQAVPTVLRRQRPLKET